MAKHSKLTLVSAIALALSACAVGPDYQRPDTPFVEASFAQADQYSSEAAQGALWEALGDADQDLVGGWVAPVQVLDDQQQWAVCCQALEKSGRRVQQLAAFLAGLLQFCGNAGRVGSRHSLQEIVDRRVGPSPVRLVTGSHQHPPAVVHGPVAHIGSEARLASSRLARQQDGATGA